MVYVCRGSSKHICGSVFDLSARANQDRTLDREKTMKRIIAVIVSLVVVLGGAFGWFYMYGPCGVQRVTEAVEQMQVKADEFDDALTVASSTARISLSGPVAQLQTIRRETDNIAVPACLQTAKNLTVSGMQSYIDSLISFMGEVDDFTVNAQMTQGNNYLSQAVAELEDVSVCAPFCNP
jgi:hypothetical protein